MALKEFGDATPRTRDKNWKEDIPMAEMPKLDTWYIFRIVGGVFTYAQHWIKFTNKAGENKTYPTECSNWNRDTEDTSKKGGCPACEAGIKASVKYMINVISRTAQERGDDDPIRALEIPPTVMRQIMDLKNLNKHKGETYHVTHPRYGMDVFLEKQRSQKKGGTEWQVQRGEKTGLTSEEKELELIDFEEFWLEPDIVKCRADLTRHGYFENEPANKGRSASSTVDDDDEDDIDFSSRKSRKNKRKRTQEDEFDVEDDDEEAPEPRRRKKKKRPAPPPEDDDEFDDDDDDEEDPPPRKKRRKKRPAPPVDDDDDDEDDEFDDDEFDI